MYQLSITLSKILRTRGLLDLRIFFLTLEYLNIHNKISWKEYPSLDKKKFTFFFNTSYTHCLKANFHDSFNNFVYEPLFDDVGFPTCGMMLAHRTC